MVEGKSEETQSVELGKQCFAINGRPQQHQRCRYDDIVMKNFMISHKIMNRHFTLLLLVWLLLQQPALRVGSLAKHLMYTSVER